MVYVFGISRRGGKEITGEGRKSKELRIRNYGQGSEELVLFYFFIRNSLFVSRHSFS
jgi:hypothetical protein